MIERYEGRVAQELGDGLMCYFGWPEAQEDAAVRCVHSALEIVQAIKAVPAAEPLSVRVTSATGQVVVSRTMLAIGEPPNLAEKLKTLAGPDEVVISDATRLLLGGAFDLDDLGVHHLQGITKPVHAWRVLRVGDAPSRFDASHATHLTPLVGREEELAVLLDRQRRSREMGGQLAMLSGEPGIGKSRVLNELRKHLEAQGVQALRFQCLPYYVDHALWPSIDHFERTLKFARNEDAESKLNKLEAFMVGEFGLPREDVRFIASLLSIPCDARYGPRAMTPQQLKDETLRTLVDALDAAARKRPSAVLFEDVHWADATTLEVLDLMVRRVKEMPLLVVLTQRPRFQNPSWTNQDHAVAIDLGRLTPEQSATMISRLAGGKPLPRELVTDILKKTDGLPLFVEELTKSVLESGKLRDAGDRYESLGPVDRWVPPTLQDSLMSRLDHANVKEIAQVGAAIGREFSHELVLAVAPRVEWTKAFREDDELQQALDRLTGSGLVARRGTLPEASYSFKHALVQDAAYDSLLKAQRPALHAQIARTIEERFPNLKDTEPELLAIHYSRAGHFERGATFWIKAGQKALSRMALKEAIAFLSGEQAIEHRTDDEKEFWALNVIERIPNARARDSLELECRVLLSTAWEALEGWASENLARVLKPVRALAVSTGQPERLARTLWGLWVQLMSIGPVAESLTWAEQLLGAGKETDNEELLLVGHMAVMVTNFWLGNPREVEAHARAILARYDPVRHGHIVKSMNHDPKTLAGIYLSQALWYLGYPDQAVSIVEARDAHARVMGHPFDIGFTLTLGTWVFHYRREPERQLARSAEVRKLAEEAVLPFLSETLLPYLSTGIALAQQGNLLEGIADMKRSIQSWAAAGAKTVTPFIRSRLGEALALSGDVDAGLAHVEAMLAQIDQPGWQERSHLAEILRLKGWMLSLKGDQAGAERSYLASLNWARQQHARSWELRTATSLARLWKAQGRRKEGYDLLAPIYDWFTEGFDTRDLMDAKALLDQLRLP